MNYKGECTDTDFKSPSSLDAYILHLNVSTINFGDTMRSQKNKFWKDQRSIYSRCLETLSIS